MYIWYNGDVAERNRNKGRQEMFKTGAQVIATDPVWFDEEVAGFVAKQLDEHKFLVKLEKPFRRTNPHTTWLTCYRDFASQTIREI